MDMEFGSMLYIIERERERMEEEEGTFDEATVVVYGRTYTGRRRRREAPASPALDPETLMRTPQPTPAFWQTTPRSTSSPQGHAAARGSKRGRVPASDKAIRGLRVAAAADSSGECAICLQGFDFQADPDEKPTLRAMPCSHAFHERCIFEWLRRNAVCPLCRFQLPTEKEEDTGAVETEIEEDREGRRRAAAIAWEQYSRDFHSREHSRRRTRRRRTLFSS